MKLFKILIFLPISLLLIISGCTTLMPSEVDIIISPWSEYGEAKRQFDKIDPYKTDINEMKKLSFDPEKVSNTRYLNYLSIRNLFLNNPSVKVEDLPMGIQDCFNNFEQCYGFEFKLENIKIEGKGSIFLRMLKFKEEDVATGPSVYFRIFLVKDIIVYKLPPEGIPDIQRYVVKKRPLGFLQDISENLKEKVFSLSPTDVLTTNK